MWTWKWPMYIHCVDILEFIVNTGSHEAIFNNFLF